MVYWQVTRNKTWYTGKLQEIRHGILVSYKKETILVSNKKEDMLYW